MAKAMSPTIPRAVPQGDIRGLRSPMLGSAQAGGASPHHGGGPLANGLTSPSGSSVGAAPQGLRQSVGASSSTRAPASSPAGSATGARNHYGNGASPPSLPGGRLPGARPTSAQSVQSHGGHSPAVQSSASTAPPPRPLSAQSGQAQGKPDLRRWTDEDLRRQIHLLEKGLNRASGGGSAVGSNSGAVPKQSSPAKGPQADSARSSTVAARAPVTLVAVPSVGGGTSPLVGANPSGASSPVPPPSPSPESTDECEAPGHLHIELSLKERQVVELRAQIARREKQLTSPARSEEHADPERTGGMPLGSGALGSVPALPGTVTAGMLSAPSAAGASASLERLVSLEARALAERAGGSGAAGASTPGGNTVPSTPGGRDTSQLEGELAWVVRQMEGHRRTISEQQQKLAALEKRHAEIITALSAHGIGGVRSPASTAAERLEILDDSTVGYDAVATRLNLHKDLLEAASGESSLRREGPPALDDTLGTSMASSTLSATAARAAERAERALRGLHNNALVRGSSRPTSAGSGTSAGSRDVGSIRSAAPSARSAAGNPFAPKVGLDALGRVQRSNNSATSSAAGSRLPEGSDVGGSTAPVLDGAGSEPPRSFGKSYEAERIVYLLTQFGMKRPLRVPFVPLDAAVDGEGRPYLHGALEVRLCLSEDGNRLMVRVGSGPTGVGGRLFEIEEFVNRAEAIEARRSQRPTPIAEEGAPQLDPPGANSGLGMAFNVDKADMSLMTMLGRKQDADLGHSSLPWKKLFKSHWN